jgi:hypothetical protein
VDESSSLSGGTTSNQTQYNAVIMTEEEMQAEEDMQNKYIRNINRKTSFLTIRKFRWDSSSNGQDEEYEL